MCPTTTTALHFPLSRYILSLIWTNKKSQNRGNPLNLFLNLSQGRFTKKFVGKIAKKRLEEARYSSIS
jgi:hypothetical protein